MYHVPVCFQMEKCMHECCNDAGELMGSMQVLPMYISIVLDKGVNFFLVELCASTYSIYMRGRNSVTEAFPIIAVTCWKKLT